MLKKKIIIPLTGVVASVAASSASATATEAVNSAIAEGQTLVGTIAPGVIGIAALMLGVGIAVSWLRK